METNKLMMTLNFALEDNIGIVSKYTLRSAVASHGRKTREEDNEVLFKFYNKFSEKLDLLLEVMYSTSEFNTVNKIVFKEEAQALIDANKVLQMDVYAVVLKEKEYSREFIEQHVSQQFVSDCEKLISKTKINNNQLKVEVKKLQPMGQSIAKQSGKATISKSGNVNSSIKNFFKKN